ncbi:MAG TPA: NUDIX hydrolase [Tepidisphaeraceae bacterium]|nr:NUDIX hydrolase [Tepidisphaeraceae bacterium]
MPRLIEKQVVYDGKKVRLEVHHLELDDGRRHKAEVVAHPGAVVVLPLLPDDTVILIRNRRYAVGQVLLELPAGTLERGEDPINGAGRELAEETGYVAGRLRPIGAFFSSPGILSEKMYAYVAEDLEQRQAAPEVGEEIELQPTPLADVIEMIGTGEIKDAKTIAAVLMYDRFRRGQPQQI